MGLFDKFKKNVTNVWDNAYKANPQFYAKDDGSPFGAFALTEGTETILPKAPNYAVEGNTITEYRLMLVSTTKDAVIGDMDYSIALSKLDNYKLDEAADSILIRGLSLDELEDLVKTESKGVNKIEDKELKEWIANNAINLLEKDKDYSELANTIVEFGYLYDFEGHGIEALMKVITDKDTLYFAVQGTKMMRVNLTEELFNTTVEGFMKIHR